MTAEENVKSIDRPKGMPVNIGDIVIIRYLDFNEEIKQGIFLVYSKDNYWLSNLKSFSALKICTNPLSYQVPITKQAYPKLDHDSFVNCSCQERFHEDNVLKILDTVDSFTLECIRKQVLNYYKDVNIQLEQTVQHYNRIEQSFKNRLHT